MKLILLSGKAQAGKDTTANILKTIIAEDNKKSIIFHYADFLKYIAKQYFNWDGKKDEKGRSLLQHLGTEVFRGNKPDCWINMAKEFILGLGKEVDYVIIADCRFKNEIEWPASCGIDSCKIRIERPKYDNGLTEEQKRHPSETELDNENFDYTIENIGAIDFLSE